MPHHGTGKTTSSNHMGGVTGPTDLENLSSGENLAGWADMVLRPEGVIFLSV